MDLRNGKPSLERESDSGPHHSWFQNRRDFVELRSTSRSHDPIRAMWFIPREIEPREGESEMSDSCGKKMVLEKKAGGGCAPRPTR